MSAAAVAVAAVRVGRLAGPTTRFMCCDLQVRRCSPCSCRAHSCIRVTVSAKHNFEIAACTPAPPPWATALPHRARRGHSASPHYLAHAIAAPGSISINHHSLHDHHARGGALDQSCQCELSTNHPLSDNNHGSASVTHVQHPLLWSCLKRAPPRLHAAPLHLLVMSTLAFVRWTALLASHQTAAVGMPSRAIWPITFTLRCSQRQRCCVTSLKLPVSLLLWDLACCCRGQLCAVVVVRASFWRVSFRGTRHALPRSLSGCNGAAHTSLAIELSQWMADPLTNARLAHNRPAHAGHVDTHDRHGAVSESTGAHHRRASVTLP